MPPFVRREGNDQPLAKSVSVARRRLGLANLLVEVLERSSIQKLDEYSKNSDRRIFDEQIERIEEIAEQINLDDGQPMSNWFATSFAEYMRLRKRLDDELDDWRNGRPHGIYLDTFSRIVDTTLFHGETANTPYIQVDGHLYIYGGYEAARVPYLAICVVAKPSPGEKPRVIRAYAHPCLSRTNWALVDSALEKETLDQIIACKQYLNAFGIEIGILKPLSDMGPRHVSERPVCIPDFVISANGPNVLASTVVVETMGYQTASYRNRKREMKKWFHQVGAVRDKITPVIKHDRNGESQPEAMARIDSEFWMTLRNTLSSVRGPRPTLHIEPD